MTNKIAIVISPNFRDYAKKYLSECIESIRQQDYLGEKKIFITDNETSPESFSLLRKIAPEAELVLNTGNDGFAKGCNDSIKQALMQGGFEYIFFVNMDTAVDKSCLGKIIEKADANPNACLIQARIMLYDKKEYINSLGNDTHFLGFGFSRGYNEKWEDVKNKTNEKIMYPSGSGFLLRVSCLEKIGLFDEKLWMYNEDQDLGWRSLLAGFDNLLASEAVVYHKYEFAKSMKQFYYMDRNRIIEILKNYKLGTLLLIMPAFIIMELGLILFSLKSGWFKEKVKVWLFFTKISTWDYILRERKISQALRVIKDKDIIELFSGNIWYQELNDWKLKAINPFFNFYWALVKKLIVW